MKKSLSFEANKENCETKIQTLLKFLKEKKEITICSRKFLKKMRREKLMRTRNCNLCKRKRNDFSGSFLEELEGRSEERSTLQERVKTFS